MKIRVSSLALLLATLAAAAVGCDINIDTPDGGNRDAETDGDEADSGGDSMLSGDDSDDSSGPSLPTAGGDDGSMGDESSGGDTPSSACESYCVAELSCDTFYDSQVECAQECEEGRIDAGDCAPSLDGLNTCLGLLSCDDFFEFWYAISAIEMGESTGDFPCVDEFIDYGVCLEGTGV